MPFAVTYFVTAPALSFLEEDVWAGEDRYSPRGPRGRVHPAMEVVRVRCCGFPPTFAKVIRFSTFQS